MTAPVNTLGLTAAQQSNAQIIIAEGKRLGQTPKAILTALTVAVDESGLQNYSNINYTGPQPGTTAVGHDHGSVGVFQQQSGQVPGNTANWGTVAELETPAVAADKFYQALDSKADAGTAAIPQLAQEIQGSGTASGANYAAALPRGTSIFNALYSGTPGAGGTALAGTAGSGTASSTSNATLASFPGGGFDPLNWGQDIINSGVSDASKAAAAIAQDATNQIIGAAQSAAQGAVNLIEEGAFILIGIVFVLVGLVILAHAATNSSAAKSAQGNYVQPVKTAYGKGSSRFKRGTGTGGGAGDAEDVAEVAEVGA